METGEKSCCTEETSGFGRRSATSVVKIVGLLVLGAVLIVGLLKDTTTFDNTVVDDTISVIGQGKMPIKPDAALINLGVLTIKADSPEAAIMQTSEKLSKVGVALDALGIPKENRQMTGYAVSPRYKDLASASDGTNPTASKPASIDGYTCTQQITVRVPNIVDDPEAVNKVITAAAKEGVNQVGEVKFIATNVESVKQEARLRAVANAKDNAKNMADVAGVKLAGITTWNESVLSEPGQNYNSNYYGSPPQGATVPTPPSSIVVLQPGQLDVVVELNVTYRVKK